MTYMKIARCPVLGCERKIVGEENANENMLRSSIMSHLKIDHQMTDRQLHREKIEVKVEYV